MLNKILNAEFRFIVVLIWLILFITGTAEYASADINITATDSLVLVGAKLELTRGTKYNTDMLDTYFAPMYLNGVKQNRSIYPNGDVRPTEGVCTDLIVRACRNAGIGRCPIMKFLKSNN